ncbi:MAG: DUF6067 family protein, partial [Rikenellaceae bacterium]
MKKIFISTLLLIASSLTTFAQDFKPDAALYTVGFWAPDTLGNHRAIVQVDNPAEFTKAIIPWRRRDKMVDETGLIIINAQNGKRVENLLRGKMSSEAGEIIFDATLGKGNYYIYYLPYHTSGGPYPKIKYSRE